MIDLVAWPASVRLFIVLLPFTFLIIGTATQAFIAHSRYFNALRRAFRRSSGFEDEINCWGGLDAEVAYIGGQRHEPCRYLSIARHSPRVVER